LENILIIGGGVGGALAYDLALRGFHVTLVEKGELLSGTTGRHHGLLHSGARYVMHDTEAARECFQENQVLKRIAPQAIEPNGGLFIALDDDDLSFRRAFINGCRQASIPAHEVAPGHTRAMEPNLTAGLKAAVQVPDAAMDAFRLAMSFFAAAKIHGAHIRTFCEVTGLAYNGRTVSGVHIHDHVSGRNETIGADIVINSAGPWAGRIANLAGLKVPIQPVPGVMVSVNQRLTQAVINRLRPAGEGDIVVPQRRLSILGTTAWPVDDPDQVNAPVEHVQRLFSLCARMIPGIKDMSPHAVWSASRPLLNSADPENGKDTYSISRTFDCIDHAAGDGTEGLVTLVGGKATTMRAMAEKTADLICQKTGRQIACRTRTNVLPSHRIYWKTPP
jgi:glycerol-3-phosphate dehydrogenase